MIKKQTISPKDTNEKFDRPIVHNLYTNREIIAILERYNADMFKAIHETLCVESINEMNRYLDRMKFLIGQIKLGGP